MKQWILHILTTVLAAILFVSCTPTAWEDDLEPTAEEVKIQLTLLAGDSFRSRNAAEQTADADYESAINLADANAVQVLVYKADGTFWDEPTDLTIIKNAVSNTYTLKGTLKALPAESKIMILANCRIDNPAVPLSSLALSYDYAEGKFDAANPKAYIPMWGIASCTYVPSSDKTLKQRINLLRALAKVHVVMNNDIEICTLDAVTLKYYNTQGSVLPAGFSDMIHTEDVALPAVPVEAQPSKELPLRRQNVREYIAYIPEYKNIGVEEEAKAVLELKMSDKYQREYVHTAVFKDYAQGDAAPWDILRNQYYKFNILKVVDLNAELTLEMRVEAYAGFDLRPEYGD